MKILKTIVVLFIVLTGYTTYAQDGVVKNTTEYKAHAEGWLVDINEAYAISKKTGKPIMANFTGSDWCGWCKRLKYEVFDKDEFKKWAKENVVLLELDFPKRFQLPENIKQQNYSLAKGFSITGYPTILVFNLTKKDGNYNIETLGQTGYVKGITAFIGGIDAILNRAKQKGN